MILVSGSGLFNSEDMIRSVSRSLCGVKKDLIYWSPREGRKNIEISYPDAAPPLPKLLLLIFNFRRNFVVINNV